MIYLKKIICLFLAVILTALFAVPLCSCTADKHDNGLSAPAYTNITMENPKITLDLFVEAMRECKFEKAESYVMNYTTMGFEGIADVPRDSADWQIYEMLFDSYKVQYKNSSTEDVTSPYTSEDLNVNGRKAVITFTFTSFSYKKMMEELSAAISEVGGERMYYGETFETQEEALALVDDAFEIVLKNDASKYYSEKSITMNAWYNDGEWKLEISDEFYAALIGR